MKVVTVKEMQSLDEKTILELGLPGMVLMERASLGVIEVIEKELDNILYSKKTALITVGTGNNGGDGLAIARLLFTKGKSVNILLIGEDSKRSEENKIQLEIINKMNIPVSIFSESTFLDLTKNSDLLIDAIFGVGLTRQLTGEYKKLVDLINGIDCIKIAVDIPSGLDSDTGQILGNAVKADYTVTFAFPKTGLLTDNALDNVGKLSVVDIGIPEIYEKNINTNYLTRNYIQKIVPLKRKKSAFKGNYGRSLLIGGSESMSGAIVLAARAALKSGVGLLNILVPENIHSIVASQIPTAMVGLLNENAVIENMDSADAITFGPGAGQTPETETILRYLIKNYKKPLVLDADALNLLVDNLQLLRERKEPIILTPHVGELARLLKTTTKEVQEDRLVFLKEFTNKYDVLSGNIILVFKGAKTLISDGKEIYINSSGNPSLSRGGTGDILSGLIGGLLAQKIDPLKAAVLGVYLHGLMADLAVKTLDEQSIITEELIDFISPAFLEIRKEKAKSGYLFIKEIN